MNPINAPDPWARAALHRFAAGEEEVTAIVDIDSQPYLRLIRPMHTREKCLKCHAHQGYKVGDIRGGVGVSVPMTPYLVLEKETVLNLVLSHLAIWLFGLIGILLAGNRLNRHFRQLQDSRHYWLSTFNAIGDMVLILGLDKRVLRANRTACESLDATESELRVVIVMRCSRPMIIYAANVSLKRRSKP